MLKYVLSRQMFFALLSFTKISVSNPQKVFSKSFEHSLSVTKVTPPGRMKTS